MMHDVLTPLSQFCHLVREGIIPGEEIRKLVDKYSRPEENLSRIFDKVLESARKAAEEVPDLHIRASARVVIAGFSHKDEDINAALESVGEISNGLRCQTLVALVKTLAEAGKFDKAWKVVVKINDQYWMTTAVLFIACVSESPDDFRRAKLSAKHIRDKCARNEALADIMHAEAHRKHRSALLKKPAYHRQEVEAINDLVRALADSAGFEEVHEAALEVESATRKMTILESLCHALSKLISPH